MNRKGSKNKGPRFYWDAERLERLRIGVNAGKTRQEIAAEFKVPRYTIDHGIAHHGVTHDPRRGPKIHQHAHEPRHAAAAPPSDIPWPDARRLMAGR